MLQLQFLSSQTLNPRLCPSQSLFTTKGNELRCRSQQLFFCSTVAYTIGALPSRVYVGHSIYKGKAALTVEPRAPEFVSLDSGAIKLSKEGFVLLQFAPAVGVRQYDWSRKQVFSLSVTEIGTLVGLGARESCEFFHDPFKGRSEEGKVRKVLKVEPLPDGSGHFFNLSVQNKLINLDENIYIPITKAEFAVLVSAFNFILPYFLDMEETMNGTGSEPCCRVLISFLVQSELGPRRSRSRLEPGEN
ncbi:hypothetical protein JRO89_XS05G0058500 [Xanthoceras sorbifolium]|uniref:Single-stranded DNA-binding protein WHY1, chloroplastic n=1 Tax=Xanthoceras sorbifolium TaxID=99658 RepID=A0ABQ8I0L1_9ROSI|nr:hypothetical protein JRO89_XS05G0058500 [Xanthoceras sorbifolium]